MNLNLHELDLNFSWAIFDHRAVIIITVNILFYIQRVLLIICCRLISVPLPEPSTWHDSSYTQWKPCLDSAFSGRAEKHKARKVFVSYPVAALGLYHWPSVRNFHQNNLDSACCPQPIISPLWKVGSTLHTNMLLAELKSGMCELIHELWNYAVLS